LCEEGRRNAGVLSTLFHTGGGAWRGRGGAGGGPRGCRRHNTTILHESGVTMVVVRHDGKIPHKVHGNSRERVLDIGNSAALWADPKTDRVHPDCYQRQGRTLKTSCSLRQSSCVRHARCANPYGRAPRSSRARPTRCFERETTANAASGGPCWMMGQRT